MGDRACTQMPAAQPCQARVRNRNEIWGQGFTGSEAWIPGACRLVRVKKHTAKITVCSPHPGNEMGAQGKHLDKMYRQEGGERFTGGQNIRQVPEAKASIWDSGAQMNTEPAEGKRVKMVLPRVDRAISQG